VHPTLLVEPDRRFIVVCSNEPYALVLIMRYTSLSIGDAAGLPKSHVTGDRIITNRDKTGKEVYVGVPNVVIDALNAAPHDGAKYFFWSGNGLIHTRASTWNSRPWKYRDSAVSTTQKLKMVSPTPCENRRKVGEVLAGRSVSDRTPFRLSELKLQP